MYIDSLTITALVVFVAALFLFIRFCVFEICGLVEDEESPDADSVSGIPRP